MHELAGNWKAKRVVTPVMAMLGGGRLPMMYAGVIVKAEGRRAALAKCLAGAGALRRPYGTLDLWAFAYPR
jgi:hypothetical protein